MSWWPVTALVLVYVLPLHAQPERERDQCQTCKKSSSVPSRGLAHRVEAPKAASPKVKRKALPRITLIASGFKRFAGRPFIKGASDTETVAYDDVKQGALNDCYLLAALAAVAHTDPLRIRAMIHLTPDGKYRVKLARYSVIIDDRFPVFTHAPQALAYAQKGDVVAEQVELWPALIEKAFASTKGSYGAIEWGHSNLAMELLWGETTTWKWVWWHSEASVRTIILQAVKRGHPVAFLNSTKHCVALVGVSPQGVTLYDPYGVKSQATWKQLKETMKLIYIGKF